MLLSYLLKPKKTNKPRLSKDKPWRSILITISWRLVGTLDTIIIAYWLTGETTIAFSIGSVELFTKMVLYYVHERAWNVIPVGRNTSPAPTQKSSTS